MTKRLKVYLLILFAAACLACTLVGCKIGRPGRAELLDGYSGHVTYYSNGGSFNDSTTISVLDVYYRAGNGEVPFFNITPETESMKLERRGYDFLGWCKPARYTAEDEGFSAHIGEIKYEFTYTPGENDEIADYDANNEDNKTVAVFPLYIDGKRIIDSETDRPLYTREGKEDRIQEKQVQVICDGETIDEKTNPLKITRDTDEIVCALWVPAAKIEYKLVVTDETGKILTDDQTVYEENVEGSKRTFKNGDIIISDVMVGDGAVPQDRDRLSLKGLTFVKTYMDEELTQEVTYVPRPEHVGAKLDPVYCRYIVGDWTVVKDAGGVKNMFRQIDLGKNFLILNDVDYSGGDIDLNKSFVEAKAKIVCNGNTPITLSNLKFAVSGNVGRYNEFSMFGTISSDFSISGGGLIIKDTSVSLPKTAMEFSFCFVCNFASASAAENVKLTIDTVTATYINKPINDIDSSAWIKGGANNFAHITVTGNNTITQQTETA